MKLRFKDLQKGDIYKAIPIGTSVVHIIIKGEGTSSDCICPSQKRFSKDAKFSDASDYFLPTYEEELHLQACIEAGKYVPLEEIKPKELTYNLF